MNEIKNKIITISGEPKSGKSTVVKFIKEKYEKQGFRVHVYSIGQLFRDSMKEEWIKVHPDKPNANLADMQEDESFAGIRSQIDKMLDKDIVEKKGKEINSKERPNDIYIIDARLGWQNIPNSFAVRLTVNEKEAGKRAFKDKGRGSEDEYSTVEEAIEKTAQRKFWEIERYKKRYGVDLTNPENYNLIADTTYSNTEELADIIVHGEELYREEKHCAKYWASPTHFLPLPKGRITGMDTLCGNTIESLAEDIRKNGYHTAVDGVLEIIEKDGVKFLLEGNHRTFGALSAGKTLLPYVVTNRDNELVENRTKYIIDNKDYMEYLYDYAEGIEYYGGGIGGTESLKNFSIKDLLQIDKIPIAQKILKEDEGR